MVGFVEISFWDWLVFLGFEMFVRGRIGKVLNSEILVEYLLYVKNYLVC